MNPDGPNKSLELPNQEVQVSFSITSDCSSQGFTKILVAVLCSASFFLFFPWDFVLEVLKATYPSTGSVPHWWSLNSTLEALYGAIVDWMYVERQSKIPPSTRPGSLIGNPTHQRLSASGFVITGQRISLQWFFVVSNPTRLHQASLLQPQNDHECINAPCVTKEAQRGR